MVVVVVVVVAAVVVIVAVKIAKSSIASPTIPMSFLFHCVSSPVHEVKRPNQVLSSPLGSIGCPPSLSQDLQA